MKNSKIIFFFIMNINFFYGQIQVLLPDDSLVSEIPIDLPDFGFIPHGTLVIGDLILPPEDNKKGCKPLNYIYSNIDSNET